MPKMVTIHYKCSCMPSESSFEMPARRFNEDIEDFMERLKKWLGRDHSDRSPFCRATKTEYVKMPVHDGAPIGSSKEDLN